MGFRSVVIVLLAGLALQGVASPYGDGFGGADLSRYLQHGDPSKVELARVEGMRGKQCLALKQNTEIRFVKVPVDEKAKYTLSFRCRFDGGEAAEENPRLLRFAANGWVPTAGTITPGGPVSPAAEPSSTTKERPFSMCNTARPGSVFRWNDRVRTD